MNKDKIYQRIQNQLRNVPLILIGTGGTIPYGISGMGKLSKKIKSELSVKYSKETAWKEFEMRLSSGIDLETALTDIHLSENIRSDIIEVTWNLVSEDDINLMHKWIAEDERPTLGGIIQKFYKADPQCVNIITTNYDRVIEYACDQYRIPVNTLFHGEFFKRFNNDGIPNKKIVNLLKVHGSLDWFYMGTSQVISVPLQEKIPSGFSPAVVTPGTEKYERVLMSPFREVLHVADELISKSSGYLCIGYGFNDNQIQANIINGIRAGKSITIWTKQLSKNALDLITKSGDKYIIVQADESDDSKSRIIFPECEEILDEKIWDMEGLFNII